MHLAPILKAIKTQRSYQAIIDRFKAGGGSLGRWSRVDMLVMADAITRAEDAAEYNCIHPKRPTKAKMAERAALKAVRRRLENYVNDTEFAVKPAPRAS